MAQEFGAFLSGVNLILRALSGGRVIMESAFSRLLVKTHNAAVTVAGNMTVETIEPIVTADATATVIKSIPVALNTVVHGVVRIVGKRTGTADGISTETIFGFVNNAGTTAALATAINRVMENSAGTPALTVVANDTNDTLDITVAGIAAQNWTWSGYVEYQTLTYA
jgi:hypothetical protein